MHRGLRPAIVAVATLAALLAAPAAAHAAPLPSEDEALFVSAVDGSVYGLLEQVAVDAASATLVELGAFPFDEEAAAQIRVTAVDHVAETGDVIALVTGLIGETYACLLVTIDGETGEPAETPVLLGDGVGGRLDGLTAPCTALDTAPAETLAPTALPVEAGVLDAVDEVGPIAVVGTADSTLLIVDIATGLTFEPTDIGDAPEVPLEALALVPVEIGEGDVLFVLLLAYENSLVFWFMGFEPDPQLIDLVPGRIVGLDRDASGRAWFTWIDESGDEDVTRLGAVDLIIGPSPALGSASGSETDDRGLPGIELLPASADTYGAISLDGSPVVIEGITVVPAGFGEVSAGGDDDELAATGTSSAGALVLAALAVLLVGAGAALTARRRTA